MAGTKEGAAKTAATNRAKYGDDYYRQIAKMGKGVKRPGAGFAANRERARVAGTKGGHISRRGKKAVANE